MAFSINAGDIKETSAINVVPLIDVLLVLLIIFMVTAPLMTHKVVVELPKATLEQRDDKVPPAPPVTVTVTAGGQLFWNDQPVTPAMLESQLSVEAQKTPQPAVNIRGDATTKYRSIAQVVNTAQAQGIRKVGFVSERDKRH
ncbi:ExbD/TolR family protein [Cognatiluteimonas weifangensis]|uniref:Biopolymer transporter ExbD n=1 Tax=Cognatiluteimonas weifangensis TaxID=2303539 RepID=A0A372DPJ3_9GAMM|nr:biopolymer transporter ExbD [Luteimonas weifangensis]RFP61439.1 biopolymer transporter ExbD [Luteimonas weifangensis]